MKTEGIILAAGLSSRVGANKLILEIDGITIIERCILSMYDYCTRIIVVGGHNIDEIYFSTKDYPKVDLVYNQDYLSGMLSSVKTGLKVLAGDRFFLTPGDYPMIHKATYQAMLKVNEDIVVPVYNNKKGHPVLMNTYLSDEIINDLHINSLRDFIEKKGATTLEVVDPGVLFDVDTIKDYELIRSGF
ncbi:MAG: nucleotidyltransferase family protein [Tissierella sp.]|nr:nucleotidyltransferase family protein [Tissierella sp.]